MSIIYEVNLTVQASIVEAYLPWLQAHIQEMLALPGFLGAQLFQEISPDNTDTRLFVVQYELESQAALYDYLQNYAPKMRQDGVARFGDKFSATRRVMQAVDPSTPLATSGRPTTYPK